MLRKFNQDIMRSAGKYSLPVLIDLLCRSLRVEIENGQVIENLERENKNYVFAFWHGTMLLPWYLQKGKNFASLISKSKDGNLLAGVLRHWDYEVVRGSSSSGGDIALGILVDFAKNKKSVSITPDGPRGPAYKMKAGAVVTARKSGIPLVLAGAGYKNKRFLSSWDRFQVPVFFSRAKVILSDPIYVDRNLSYEETSRLIAEAETELNDLQRRAGEF